MSEAASLAPDMPLCTCSKDASLTFRAVLPLPRAAPLVSVSSSFSLSLPPSCLSYLPVGFASCAVSHALMTEQASKERRWHADMNGVCCSPKQEFDKVLPDGPQGQICITTYDGKKMCVASDRDAWPWLRVQRRTEACSCGSGPTTLTALRIIRSRRRHT